MGRFTGHLSRTAALAAVALSLAGCFGSDNGGGGGVLDRLTTGTRFWAVNVTTDAPYPVVADQMAEGTHCRIFVEQGAAIDQATIEAFVREFDDVIYPSVTAAFGSEPNPGVDNDVKITILFLDIKDGFDPVLSPSYVAGYFSTGNEYPVSVYPYSNQREMFYIDTYPAVPGSPASNRTLAHEFQHMIHWEQKDHLRLNLEGSDDIWLNEAMSEAAPYYCGYGPDLRRIDLFEVFPSDSLTVWRDSVVDYGVAHMWSVYCKDRFGDNILRGMLQRSETGIDSVDAALAAAGAGTDFAGLFRDWSIAAFSGNSTIWPGHPEWNYTSLDVHPNTLDNLIVLPPLDAWSMGYYRYLPLSGTSGSVTWDNVADFDMATFIDWGGGTLTYDMLAGVPYQYTDNGFLILQNLSSQRGGGEDVVLQSAGRTTRRTLKEFMESAGSDPAVRNLSRRGGGPVPLCIHPFLLEREAGLRATLRAQGKRLSF